MHPPPLPHHSYSFPPLSLPTDSLMRGQTQLTYTSYGIRSRTSPCDEVRRDPERYVGYGITDSWDEIVETLQGAPVSTDTELGAHMREFESLVRRDTDEIHTRFGYEQGQRQFIGVRPERLGDEPWIRAILLMEGLYLYGPQSMHRWRRSQSYSQPIVDAESQFRTADCSDLDCYADITEGDGSTTGTSHYIAGTGDDIAGDSCLPYRDSQDSLEVQHTEQPEDAGSSS
ncbi:hypothetical protein Tco_1560885 [Tanacetum coccineum]